MIADFAKDEAVCSTEPYLHFLDGNGSLNVGLFVEKVVPDTRHYDAHWHDIALWRKSLHTERAPRAEKLELLQVRHSFITYSLPP